LFQRLSGKPDPLTAEVSWRVPTIPQCKVEHRQRKIVPAGLGEAFGEVAHCLALQRLA
jgi:hypothetical protein